MQSANATTSTTQSPAVHVIQIPTPNQHSINKVLAQQAVEVIGQVTYQNLSKDPSMMIALEPMILELYKQITRYTFSLEADEKRKTGNITHYPELKELVDNIWSNIWTKYEQIHTVEKDT